MPTNAKTHARPFNLSLSTKALPINTLIFNQAGKIDVAQLDDTAKLVTALGLDESIRIPLETITKANMIFAISQKIGVTPGKSKEGDEEIIKQIKLLIAPNVTPASHSIIVKEMIAAWNTIADHELSEKYRGAIEAPEGETTFHPHGAYELFFNEYVAKFLGTLTQQESVAGQTLLFAQVGELAYSTLQGQPFSIDPHQKLADLRKIATQVKADLPVSAKQIDGVITKLAAEESAWFTDLGGLEQSVDGVIEDFAGDADKAPKLKAALLSLLAGEYPKEEHGEAEKAYDPCDDKAINMALREEVIPALQSPTQSGYFKDKNVPSVEIFRYAVSCKIRKVASERNFSLENGPSVSNLGELDEEQELLKFTMDPSSYSPVALQSILSRAKANGALSDAIGSVFQMHKEGKDGKDRKDRKDGKKAVVPSFEQHKASSKKEKAPRYESNGIDAQVYNEDEAYAQAIQASLEDMHPAAKKRRIGGSSSSSSY